MGRHDEEDDAVMGAGAVRWVELNHYVLGEMSETERLRFEERLAASPEAQARLERVKAGHAAGLSRLDVAIDSAKILERLESAEAGGARRMVWRWLAPIALAAAAAAAVAIVPLLGPDAGPTTRTKGVAPALEMYVKDTGGPRLADDGIRLGEGDAIQFRYRAQGHPYLFVLSVDARGTVSPLYPDQPTRSITVEPEGTNVLDGSVILDDAVGPERIYAVFSKTPLSYEELAKEIEEARRSERDVTSLPRIGIERDDVFETSVLIIKE